MLTKEKKKFNNKFFSEFYERRYNIRYFQFIASEITVNSNYRSMSFHDNSDDYFILFKI